MENKKLFGLICCLHRQMSREYNDSIPEYGLSHAQVHTLIYIDKCSKGGKQVCQRDIEKLLNLRPSSISSLLKHLEKYGFLTRSVSVGDARTKVLYLTEKGQSLCDKNKLIIDKADKTIQSALNEEEQEILNKLLTKIISSIQGQQEVKG